MMLVHLVGEENNPSMSKDVNVPFDVCLGKMGIKLNLNI